MPDGTRSALGRLQKFADNLDPYIDEALQRFLPGLAERAVAKLLPGLITAATAELRGALDGMHRALDEMQLRVQKQSRPAAKAAATKPNPLAPRIDQVEKACSDLAKALKRIDGALAEHKQVSGNSMSTLNSHVKSLRSSHQGLIDATETLGREASKRSGSGGDQRANLEAQTAALVDRVNALEERRVPTAADLGAAMRGGRDGYITPQTLKLYFDAMTNRLRASAAGKS